MSRDLAWVKIAWSLGSLLATRGRDRRVSRAGSAPWSRARRRRSRAWVLPEVSDPNEGRAARAATQAAAYRVSAEAGSRSRHQLISAAASSQSPLRARARRGSASPRRSRDSTAAPGPGPRAPRRRGRPAPPASPGRRAPGDGSGRPVGLRRTRPAPVWGAGR